MDKRCTPGTKRSFYNLVLSLLTCASLCICPHVLANTPIETIKVKIIGLKGDVLDNTHQVLLQDAKRMQDNMTSRRIREFIKRAPGNIKKSTAPFGYFKPKTTSRVTHQEKLWLINFTVSPGKVVKVKKFKITITGDGKNTEPFNKYIILQHKKIQIGDDFNSGMYDDAKNMLYNIAAEYGYFDAEITNSRALIDLNTHTASLNITFNTGKRYKFGKTTISSSYLSPSFLRRYLEYKEGQPFNNTSLELTQKHLNDSKFFDIANVDTHINPARSSSVPINIKLEDAKRYKYIFGGGYGTDTGIRAIVGADIRMVNRYGHSYSAQTEMSKNTNFIGIKYNIPGNDPGSETYSIHNLVGREDFSNSIGYAELMKTGVSYSNVVLSWRQTLDLSALIENYKLKDTDTSKTITLLPSIKWQKRVVTPTTMPDNGYNLSSTISGGPVTLNGYSKFAQLNLLGKGLMSFGRDTRILLRGNIILTWINNLNNLPLSLRPLAGGSESIRGFAYNSIHDGRDMLVGSAAWEQRIYKSLYLEGFCDAGTVSNSLSGQYYIGAGPGLVWQTEIGAMSFTYAKAILPRGKWLFQFNIGPEI